MRREISPLWNPSSQFNPRAEADRRGEGGPGPSGPGQWEWTDLPNLHAHLPGDDQTVPAVRPGPRADEVVREAWAEDFGHEPDGGLRHVRVGRDFHRGVSIYGLDGHRFYFGERGGRVVVRLRGGCVSPWLESLDGEDDHRDGVERALRSLQYDTSPRRTPDIKMACAIWRMPVRPITGAVALADGLARAAAWAVQQEWLAEQRRRGVRFASVDGEMP